MRCVKFEILKTPYKLLLIKDSLIPSITCTFLLVRLTPFLSIAEVLVSLILDLLIASILLLSFLLNAFLLILPFKKFSCLLKAFLVSSLDGDLSLLFSEFCLFCLDCDLRC